MFKMVKGKLQKSKASTDTGSDPGTTQPESQDPLVPDPAPQNYQQGTEPSTQTFQAARPREIQPQHQHQQSPAVGAQTSLRGNTGPLNEPQPNLAAHICVEHKITINGESNASAGKNGPPNEQEVQECNDVVHKGYQKTLQKQRLWIHQLECKCDLLEKGEEAWKSERELLRENSAQLGNKVNELEATITAQKENITSLSSSIDEVLQAADKQNEKLRRREENFASLNSKSAEQQKEIEKLQLQLKEAQAATTELRRMSNTAATELRNFKAESRSFAPESFFTQKWSILASMIVDWSQNYFRGVPVSVTAAAAESMVPYIDETRFRTLCKDPNLYLKSSDKRPLFVQSFIWVILVEEVLTPEHGLYWAQARRDHVNSLFNYLRPSPDILRTEMGETAMRKFMKWRATTAQLVLGVNNENSDADLEVYEHHFAELIHMVMKSLNIYRCSPNETLCKDGLRDILRFAIKLDAKMKQQWAEMKPRYFSGEGSMRWGFKSEPSIMEACDEQEIGGQLIQLVVAPALIRWGTLDGEQYRQAGVLAKAQVVIGNSSVRSLNFLGNGAQKELTAHDDGSQGTAAKKRGVFHGKK